MRIRGYLDTELQSDSDIVHSDWGYTSLNLDLILGTLTKYP